MSEVSFSFIIITHIKCIIMEIDISSISFYW